MKRILKKYLQNALDTKTLLNQQQLNIDINNEILWSQIFNSTIVDSSWLKKKSFSPGRWAMGYPALYILYRILNDIKPLSILEFGLGESSKMTYQYHKSNESSDLVVVEQDPVWLDFFSKNLFEIKDNVLLLPVSKVTVHDDYTTNIYENLIQNIQNKKYDCIVIDGPWGSERCSRYQINEIITNDLLADDFIILMDDYNRQGERETISDVIKNLREKDINVVQGSYKGMKATTILCSPKYSFLTSL